MATIKGEKLNLNVDVNGQSLAFALSDICRKAGEYDSIAHALQLLFIRLGYIPHFSGGMWHLNKYPEDGFAPIVETYSLADLIYEVEKLIKDKD